MGNIHSQRRRDAPLLAPSIAGNLNEVKRLIGVYIADSSSYENSNDNNLPSFINAMDSTTNNAAIHGAIYSGQLDIVQFLVDCCALHQGTRHHATVDVMGRRASTSISSTAIVNLLTLKNGLGCTPLWLAAGYDRTLCLEYILCKLGHCDILLSSLLHEGANNVGDTPILAAVSKGNVNACEIIFQSIEEWYSRRHRHGGGGGRRKCEDDTNNDNNSSKMECQRMKARVLQLANHAGDTPLQVAVASGHVELVTMLLKVDRGNKIMYHDNNNYNISNTQDTTTDSEVVDKDIIDDEYLLSSKRSIINVKNEKGLSPLIVACERNYIDIVKLLLHHNDGDADTNIRDTNGRSCLAVASFCGCIDVVTYLLKYNQGVQGEKDIAAAAATTTSLSLINAIDNHGRTPLWLAARTGNLAMTQLLVNTGADVTISDNDMVTPLDVAVKYKKEKVIEYLSSL